MFENYSDKGIYFDRLLVYDIDLDSVYLLTDSLLLVTDYAWSANDDLIIFTDRKEYTFRDNRNFIAKIDLVSKEKQIILDLNSSSKSLGDCLGNQLVYIEEKIQNGELSLMIMDLLTFDTREITNLSQFGFEEIREPVFYDESNIFLICSNNIDEDRNDEDIYILNLNTLKLKQITSTHNIKERLSYIR